MNRLFYKHYVGLDIQDKHIMVVVGKCVRGKIVLTYSQCVELSSPVLSNENMIDESVLIQQLINIGRQLPSNSVCRIALNDSQILQQTLSLPSISLSAQDKQLFVVSALNRLFPLPAHELAIDYPESNYELVITAARKQHINQWQRVFKQAGLTLDRIEANLVDDNNLQLSEPFRTAELLVIGSLRQGINLLPWRAYQCHYFYRRALYLSLFYGFLLIIFLMGGWHVTANKQQRIQQKLVQYKLVNEQLNDDFHNILSLNQNVIDMEKSVQKQMMPVLNLMIFNRYLNFLSEAVATGLWLQTLQFDHQSLTLKGNSFLYPTIMVFIKKFEEQDFIQNSQLQAIRYQGGILKFNLKTTLSLNDETTL